MIEFYLSQFPKFTKAYSMSSDIWEIDFHTDGFKSTFQVESNELIFCMEDHEYTWFVLKWG